MCISEIIDVNKAGGIYAGKRYTCCQLHRNQVWQPWQRKECQQLSVSHEFFDFTNSSISKSWFAAIECKPLYFLLFTWVGSFLGDVGKKKRRCIDSKHFTILSRILHKIWIIWRCCTATYHLLCRAQDIAWRVEGRDVDGGTGLQFLKIMLPLREMQIRRFCSPAESGVLDWPERTKKHSRRLLQSENIVCSSQDLPAYSKSNKYEDDDTVEETCRWSSLLEHSWLSHVYNCEPCFAIHWNERRHVWGAGKVYRTARQLVNLPKIPIATKVGVARCCRSRRTNVLQWDFDGVGSKCFILTFWKCRSF